MLLQAKVFEFLLFANCNLVDIYLCIQFTFTCTAHDTAKLNFIQLKSCNILSIEKGLWATVVMKNTHVTYVTNVIQNYPSQKEIIIEITLKFFILLNDSMTSCSMVEKISYVLTINIGIFCTIRLGVEIGTFCLRYNLLPVCIFSLY